MLELAGAFTLGMYAGWFMGQRWRGSDKPIFTRPIIRFAMTPPVKLASYDHFAQWQLWTRRFVLFCELVGRENGYDANQLPSRATLKKTAGVSDRHFAPYLSVLREGKLIFVIDRVGAWWTVNGRERRDALASLPYSGLSRPPRFPFARSTEAAGTAGTE